MSDKQQQESGEYGFRPDWRAIRYSSPVERPGEPVSGAAEAQEGCPAVCPSHPDRTCTYKAGHMTWVEDPHNCEVEDGKGHFFLDRAVFDSRPASAPAAAMETGDAQ